MKVQCSCGAKSIFEISEAMHRHPVRFACPACGADASAIVDSLIRQSLGQETTPGGPAIVIRPELQAPITSQAVAVAQPQISETHAKPAPALSHPPAIRLQRSHTQPAATVVVAASHPEGVTSTDEAFRPCSKHPSEIAQENCRVCSKPICPRCMELFGYVCSAICKARAASHGIEVPVYRSQKSVIEARRWRAVVWTIVGSVTLVIAGLGFWIWYTWFGLPPKQIFSVRFAEPSYSGQSAFAGPDQLVFLHGGTLARHDTRQNKQVWSQNLINKNDIKDEIAREMEQTKAAIFKANHEGWENVPKMPDPEKLSQALERQAAASLTLWVRGQKIWVLNSLSLTRYDWENGKPIQEIKLPANSGALINRGDELLAFDAESGRSAVTSVNLTSCDSRTTELSNEPKPSDKPASLASKPAVNSKSSEKAGLPTGIPGRDAGKVMDPAKVATQAQKLSFASKLALPAVLANSWNQERILAELDENPRPKTPTPGKPSQIEHFTIFPTKDGYVEFSSRLLELKTIAHSTLKPVPAKSVLDGPVNVTQSAEVANEILNEMQRERGGGVVQEDVSRYAVTLRRSGDQEVWTGEVIGPPTLLPLESVNVLAANKTLIVFDKSNKKLWQTTLNFNLHHEISTTDPTSIYGQGPVVEQKDTLYVFDAGVLSAFDLKTGNARWRLPSVGITGIFFDPQGMLYVNTTTGSPDKIKFSHQIDVNQKIISVVLKVAPKNGKIVWSSQIGGLVNYVSDKYIYTLQSYTPEEEDDNPYRQETGFEKQAFMRIKRLNPKNGHEMWEHFQQRAPLDAQFDKNYIRLVFKKEVQVLRSITW